MVNMRKLTKSWLSSIFEIIIILISLLQSSLIFDSACISQEVTDEHKDNAITVSLPKSKNFDLKSNLLAEYDSNFYIPTKVRIDKNLGVVLTYNELIMVNITNILKPTIIANYTLRNNYQYCSSLFVENNFVYLCYNDEGIEIVNITSPNNPQFSSIYKIRSKASHFAMSKNSISYCKLNIFPKIIFLDVTNPLDIKKASVTKFMGEKDFVTTVFEEDLYIYTANNRLNFLNVSNIYSVEQIKSLYLPQEFSQTYLMEFSQNKLFITFYYGVFIVIDITEIIFPILLSVYSSPEDSYIYNTNLIIHNEYVIMYDSYGSFSIINCSNLNDMKEILRRYHSCYDLQVINDYLFAVCENNRLTIANLTDIINLPIISFCQIGSYASSFFIDDSYLYCSHFDRGIEIIRIDENEQLHHINDVTFNCSKSIFYVEKDLLYVAYKKIGEFNYIFQIVNISNPFHPIYLDEYSYDNNTDFRVNNLIVQNKIIYIRCSFENKTNHVLTGYLLALNATDSSNITMLSKTKLDDFLDYGLAIKEDLLVVSDEGIKIYNISNSGNPEFISKISITTNWIRDLYLENNLVYLTLAQNIIPIIDITNPENPNIECEIIVSDPYLQNQIVYLAVNQDLLAVTYHYEEVIFYNTSNFNDIYELNRLKIGLICRSILITADNHLFVANDYDGIKYYELIVKPTSPIIRNLSVFISVSLILVMIITFVILKYYKQKKKKKR